MKAETQSGHLQKMMQKHTVHPEYDLMLPSFSVKKKRLHTLVKNDVFLLGSDILELVLMHRHTDMYAKTVLDSYEETVKMQITLLAKVTENKCDSKKYETVLCSFGNVQSRKFEVGHKIEISMRDLRKVTLFWEEKKRAEGLLVNVESEIAIKITKVYHG